MSNNSAINFNISILNQNFSLGLRFAMMQARIGLLTVLNNFEISISPTMNLPLTVCLTTFLLTPNECFLTLKPLKSYINNEVSS